MFAFITLFLCLIFLGVFARFESMEKINLLEGEDDLGSDSCPCSCHPAPGNLLTDRLGGKEAWRQTHFS